MVKIYELCSKLLTYFSMIPTQTLSQMSVNQTRYFTTCLPDKPFVASQFKKAIQDFPLTYKEFCVTKSL